MVGAAQRDEAVFLGAAKLAANGAGKLQRAFDGFRAAGREEGSGHSGELAEAFCQSARPGIAVLRREVNHPAGLVCERRQHSGVGVAQRVDSEAAHQVEVLVAVHVEEQAAFAAFHDDGVTCINWNEMLGVTGQDLAGGLVCGGPIPKMFHRL